MTQPTELERLIAREGIVIAIQPGAVGDSVVPPSRDYSTWTVTIHYQKRHYKTPFFTMYGVAPQASDVVANLCREIQTLDGTEGKFETWAVKNGYNLDSRTAYQLWQTVVTIAPKFRMFLGAKQKEFLRAKHRGEIR
jgi:hypothetical protein